MTFQQETLLKAIVCVMVNYAMTLVPENNTRYLEIHWRSGEGKGYFVASDDGNLIETSTNTIPPNARIVAIYDPTMKAIWTEAS